MKNAVIDPKDLNTIREVLTSFRTQICGAADTLGQPWKGQFLALKGGDYDKMLSGLPPTDQVPAALEANSQLNCLHAALSSATSLSVMLGSAMASLAGKSAEASAAQLASPAGAEIEKQIAAGTLFKAEGVEVRIAERIKTADLVAKRTYTQLCSAAKSAPNICSKTLDSVEQPRKSRRTNVPACFENGLIPSPSASAYDRPLFINHSENPTINHLARAQRRCYHLRLCHMPTRHRDGPAVPPAGRCSFGHRKREQCLQPLWGICRTEQHWRPNRPRHG